MLIPSLLFFLGVATTTTTTTTVPRVLLQDGRGCTMARAWCADAAHADMHASCPAYLAACAKAGR
jgi:hypothetical protein